MQLFLVAFQSPQNFIIFASATVIAATIVLIVLRSVLSSEGGAKWVKAVTNPNAKFLFTFLFIGWAIFFGITLQLVPHTGASTPYGGIGLIALFTGFFICMGLLWAVIGE